MSDIGYTHRRALLLDEWWEMHRCSAHNAGTLYRMRRAGPIYTWGLISIIIVRSSGRTLRLAGVSWWTCPCVTQSSPTVVVSCFAVATSVVGRSNHSSAE